MATIDEMDQFVNWDRADDAVGQPFQEDALAGLTTGPDGDNIDLVLANVNEDDFSFCALQHFSDNNFPLPDLTTEQVMDFTTTADNLAHQFQWIMPDSPCANCAVGGFSCKRSKRVSIRVTARPV
ncbi:hypothetical protein FSOLCH5_005711 [Fusarium solani]